jgi:probable phosphomutase (TIGR03848 family)
VATVLLVRHGRTAANAEGVLAGWTPGVPLDETGVAQAAALARRLAVVPLAELVTSPLQRCRETVQAVAQVRGPGGVPRLDPVTDDRLGECRYGNWTGRPLAELAKDPLWRVVQDHPSAVIFPGEAGESMLTMQHRALEAVRDHDVRVAAEHGDEAIWLAVSHGDVIKAVLADALGMHLDCFQRLIVDPCSVSVVRYTPLRPFAVRINDTGGDLTGLVPPRHPRRQGRRSDPLIASDAVVGGPSFPAAEVAALSPGSGAPTQAGGHHASPSATP